jgi:hypothetical protein
VAEEPAAPAPELTTDTLLGAFGGWKGVLDGSLAATVFVVARFVVDLEAAVVAAVVAGVLVVVLRRVQGESMQQAFSGFFGLVVAVLVVRSTGSGKGIFLPGILITAGSGVLFGLSLLVRQPAVALGLAAADPRYAAWRTHAPLRRACTVATAAWCASFFVRAGVATSVYLLYGDSPGDNLLLLVVINVVKWPLIIGSALLTVGLVRRAGVPPLAEGVAP